MAEPNNEHAGAAEDLSDHEIVSFTNCYCMYLACDLADFCNQEEDTFEDAADDSTHPEETLSLSPPTRSLTQRSISSISLPKSPDIGDTESQQIDGIREEVDQQNHTTFDDDKDNTQLPTAPTSSRLSKISFDGDLDNVDLEGETNGAEKSSSNIKSTSSTIQNH